MRKLSLFIFVVWLIFACSENKQSSTVPTQPDNFEPVTVWKHFNPENSPLLSSQIQTIIVDSSNVIWVGSLEGGLARYENQTWTIYDSSNSGLPSNLVSAIAVDKQDNLWLGSWKEPHIALVKFDGTTWTVYDSTNSGLPGEYFIMNLAIEDNETVWIGTINEGLVKFDGENWQTFNASNSFLKENYIKSLAIDRFGNKWVGSSNNGLAKFDGDNWTYFDTASAKFHSFGISTICVGADGNLYVEAGGIFCYDYTCWQYIKNTPGCRFVIDSKKFFWSACSGLRKHDGVDLFQIQNPFLGPATHIHFRTLCCDKKDNIWQGCEYGVFVYREGGLLLDQR